MRGVLFGDSSAGTKNKVCVRSITPVTSGKPALAANRASVLAYSAALYGTLMCVNDIRMIGSQIARCSNDTIAAIVTFSSTIVVLIISSLVCL